MIKQIKIKTKKRTNNNVLFFDDEPFISESLAENLKLYGWKVCLVTDINKLIDTIIKGQFDILILDIMAPIPEKDNKHIHFSKEDINEMDRGINTGIVIAKKIWGYSEDRFKDLPILFLTARQRPDDILIQFKQNNRTCDCLRKPEYAVTVNESIKLLLKKIKKMKK